MLLAGPSKAGKSFALIELCIAIAEEKKWLGEFTCSQGKVLYINLELDRASCFHRFKDVYTALTVEPNNLHNVEILTLRGSSIPLDKITPKLIRRATKKNYTAIVLDPIYKVITGDENSSYQMAKFCNQLDKLCTALNCAIIYCHHHSKGNQSWKSSMDRASGSGVFARDPDAIIDVIELELPQTRRQDGISAWRFTGTLRDFKEFIPVDTWFNHPIHIIEHFEKSENIAPHSELPSHQRALNARKSKEQKLLERNHRLEAAYDICSTTSPTPSVKELSVYMKVSEQTIRNSVDEHVHFKREGGKINQIHYNSKKQDFVVFELS